MGVETHIAVNSGHWWSWPTRGADPASAGCLPTQNVPFNVQISSTPNLCNIQDEGHTSGEIDNTIHFAQSIARAQAPDLEPAGTSSSDQSQFGCSFSDVALKRSLIGQHLFRWIYLFTYLHILYTMYIGNLFLT